MPLHKLAQPEKNCMTGVWEITEELPDLEILAARHGIESGVAGIKFLQKQREHLAARILVKAICDEMCLPFRQVSKDSEGKPFLNGQTCHISYSHTDRYCAAILHFNFKVGIDIELPKLKLQNVAHKFLTENEIELIGNDNFGLCRAWCAKEAVYKLIGRKGISLRTDISLPATDKVAALGKKWQVHYEEIGGSYQMAYIIDAS